MTMKRFLPIGTHSSDRPARSDSLLLGYPGLLCGKGKLSVKQTDHLKLCREIIAVFNMRKIQ